MAYLKRIRRPTLCKSPMLYEMYTDEKHIRSDHSDEGMKLCSRCKQEKERTEFSKNSSKPDGLCSWCKCCINAKQLAMRAKLRSVRKKLRSPKVQFVKRDWGTPHEYYVIKPKPTVHERFSTFLERLREQGRVVAV